MNLYRNIDRNKVQFDFVKHTHEKGAFEDEIVNLGGIIYEAPRYKIYNYCQYRSWWINHFKNHPEHKIVHGHFFTISSVYFRFAHEMSRITIGHSHSTSHVDYSVKNTMKYMLVKRVEQYSDYCFACSENAGKWVFPHKEFFVLNNAIDSDLFKYNEETRRRIRREFGVSERYVVGHIGNFSPPKNHRFIIEIFNEIRKKDNNALLILIGDRELRARIEQLVYDYDLDDSVIFAGVRDDIPTVIQSFDVFLFPSLYEGLGIVAVEAQASGLHTICSNVIPREVELTDLVDFVSLDKSAEEWADIVLKYNNGYKREDVTEEIVKAGYDIHDTAQQLQEFYIKTAESVMK
ncbi:MAG: glycosyltransferase [Clostridiales bacterium]|nr:glycosyltransferase [Clostridiales bacterium]